MDARHDHRGKRARSAVMPCSVWIKRISQTAFFWNNGSET
jgi:hypothetical protein